MAEPTCQQTKTTTMETYCKPIDPVLTEYIETASKPRSLEQITAIKRMLERHVGLGVALAFAASAMVANAATPEPPRTQHEINLTAACLIGEAGGEIDSTGTSRMAMSAVWETVWNRAASPRWRSTPAEVVVQPKQFSYFNGKTQGQAIAKAQRHPMWRHALGIVSAPPTTNLTKGSNHYYSVIIRPPYWADPSKLTARIGKHRFYRLSN